MGVPWLNIQHIVRQTSIIRRLRLPAKVLMHRALARKNHAEFAATPLLRAHEETLRVYS